MAPPIHNPQLRVKVVGHVMWAFDFADETNVSALQASLRNAGLLTKGRYELVPALDFGLRDEGLKRTPLCLREQVTSAASPKGLELDPSALITVYHLGNASVRRHFCFDGTLEDLLKLIKELKDNQQLRAEAHAIMSRLMPSLAPLSENANLSEKTEDFVVFSITVDGDGAKLVTDHASDLAQLAHLEPRPLHQERVKATTDKHIPFYAGEFVLVEWDAAVLVNVKSPAVVALLEFENARLVSTRVVRDRVEGLAGRCKNLKPAKGFMSSIRGLLPRHEVMDIAQHYGDITDLFLSLRTGLNVIGDEQLSDIHDRAEAVFRLNEEEQDISESLEAVSRTVNPLDARAAEMRAEIMELIIILLIVYEIVAPMMHRAS